MTENTALHPDSRREASVHMFGAEELNYGQDHPNAKVNVRLTDRLKNIEELKASIKEDGIIQAFSVWEDLGKLWVFDGSRRLSAIRALIEDEIADGKGERYWEKYPIPCVVFASGTVEEIMSKSLTANITQLPLHPVDQFETFSKIYQAMLETKAPEEAVSVIADHFATTPLIVRRRLALGDLSPVILEAWRNGEIEPEGARAFTIEADKDRQAKLFTQLHKKFGASGLNDYTVRRAILGDSTELGPVLKFITRAEFEAAGGVVKTDLFDESGLKDGVGERDRALLIGLYDKKLDGICEKMIADGWSWAHKASDLPANWQTWVRLPVPAKKDPAYLNPKDKARSGIVLAGLDHNGELSITWAVVKPEKVAKKSAGEKAGKADAAEAEEPSVPNAIAKSLQAQATRALGEAIVAASPAAGLRILAAGFADPNGPVRVQLSGLEKRMSGESPKHPIQEFSLALRGSKKTTPGSIWRRLAQIAAEALDLGILGQALPLQEDDAAEIVRLLGSAHINKALAAAFDAKEYFNGVSKVMCVAAVHEAMGNEHAEKVQKMSKPDASAFAVSNVPKTGWLPIELRAKCYAGPGAKGAARAKPKTKARK